MVSIFVARRYVDKEDTNVAGAYDQHDNVDELTRHTNGRTRTDTMRPTELQSLIHTAGSSRVYFHPNASDHKAAGNVHRFASILSR